MHKKLSPIVIALIVLNARVSSAQEDPLPESPFTVQDRVNQHTLGDQAFSISLGTIIPLFTALVNHYDDVGFSAGPTSSRLSAGGEGILTYSIYIFPDIKLGLQLAGTFQWDINKNLLYMVPITLKGSYEFHPFRRVTIPVHLALGINMTSWNKFFAVDFVIRPGFGVYFDWNAEWSFGMDICYWMIPQVNVANSAQKSLLNLMDISITAEYHF